VLTKELNRYFDAAEFPGQGFALVFVEQNRWLRLGGGSASDSSDDSLCEQGLVFSY
jgi:hypothetical protein